MSPDTKNRIVEALSRIESTGVAPQELAVALRELDALARSSESELPEDLRHYLSRRSYEKARMFLGDHGPIPPGACGRGA